MRDWVTNVRTTHYILGSALGSHPYPMMVRDFHRVIGVEARRRSWNEEGRLPDLLVACVGGGSNAIGLLPCVPATTRPCAWSASRPAARASRRADTPRASRAASSACSRARKTYLLARRRRPDRADPLRLAPGSTTRPSGPSTPGCATAGRVEYTYATDAEALAAFQELSRLEGIIPALESAHAMAEVQQARPDPGRDELVIVNLSGRGDKDVAQAARIIFGEDFHL